MTKKSDAPAIRFKGFSDAWEQRKFEEIAVRSSVICSDDTLPRVEYEDIVSGTGRLNKDIYAKQSIKSGIAFHQGDVLYGKLRPYLQNWLLPTFDGLAVGDFWVLQPQNADSSFLYRLIQSRQFDEVANQSTGTKMPRADWKLVSKTVFSIPSNISEQAAIGTYFTALDSLITLHQRQPFLHSTPEISLTVQLIHPFYTSSWEQRKLGDLLQTLPFKQFLKEPEPDGKYEIIQQGNEPVIGFANGTPCGDYKDVVIFGDHTLSLYKPQHPFFVATDGVRIVKGQQDTDGYYLLSLLERYKPQSEGYKRYYSILADTNCITTYNTSEQEKIGVFFKLLDNLITLHQRKGKAAVTGCSNDANNSKGVYCKARDFGYKCCKKVESP